MAEFSLCPGSTDQSILLGVSTPHTVLPIHLWPAHWPRAFQITQAETLRKWGWGPEEHQWSHKNSAYSGMQLQFTAIIQNQPKKKEPEQSLTETRHKLPQILTKHTHRRCTKCPPQPPVTTHVHLSLLWAQDSYWGLGTNALSTQHLAEPQTPKTEAGVQWKEHYL